jgi:hypothetical protein
LTFVFKGAKIAILRLRSLRRCDFTTKKTYKGRSNKWLTFHPAVPDDQAKAKAEADAKAEAEAKGREQVQQLF